jgi:predicted AlkP superfamily phosphohydrolase/phosphomutase
MTEKKTYSKRIKILFLAAFLVLATQKQAYAYIGPGAGIAVMGSFIVMFLAFLAGIFAVFTWPVRLIIRTIRRRRAFSKSKVKKMVILGLDGLDPNLVGKFMADGKLPNFLRLKNIGCFKKLATTTPPISPVAWSSFQTGVNPGKHNIFDFLTRDKATYIPKLSSVEIRPPRKKISIGKYQFPLSKPDIRLLRKGKPFWKTLGEHGIFSEIIRVPITFPAEKFNGLQLSAMCVPDIRGTQGMFSFYTSNSQNGSERTGGENFHVSKNGNTIKTHLLGCQNPVKENAGQLKYPFEVKIQDRDTALLKIDGQTCRLRKNQYSPWINVHFKAGAGIKVHGICKFLLLNTEPDFELYVTPINIDPEKPAMPISHPAVFSTYLSKQIGPYATLGLAEDSWALNEKILDDRGFLGQTSSIDDEREKMFFDALDKLRNGLCVCVFDGTDRVQHTFWRYIDDRHPAINEKIPENCRTASAIEDIYKKMDALVGKTMDKYIKDDTLFMVISDHGFNSFRYGIDLNRWLEENGYLKLNQGDRGEKYLANVDWSQTKAYAIGLAGMYLNIKGRESKGIVEKGGQADNLCEEIAEKLKELYDSDANVKPINQVYIASKIYKGPYSSESPDLLVGYKNGYRASWETAIGQTTEKIIHKNTKAWSGDHCIDPSLVPGVIFCNHPIDTPVPRLMDIGPTALDMFGIRTPAYMDGIALEVKGYN